MKTYVLKPFNEREIPLLPVNRKEDITNQIRDLEARLKANLKNPKISHREKILIHDGLLEDYRRLYADLNDRRGPATVTSEAVGPLKREEEEEEEEEELLRNLALLLKKKAAPEPHKRKLKFSPQFESTPNPFTPLRQTADQKLSKSLSKFEISPSYSRRDKSGLSESMLKLMYPDGVEDEEEEEPMAHWPESSRPRRTIVRPNRLSYSRLGHSGHGKPSSFRVRLYVCQ